LPLAHRFSGGTRSPREARSALPKAPSPHVKGNVRNEATMFTEKVELAVKRLAQRPATGALGTFPNSFDCDREDACTTQRNKHFVILSAFFLAREDLCIWACTLSTLNPRDITPSTQQRSRSQDGRIETLFFISRDGRREGDN
jgi:hypothetical protein